MLDWAEYERWMSQARKTYELIDADIEYGGYSWACFKAQQAAEFALKALLRLYGEPGFGHDLPRLYERAKSLCPVEPREEVERCVYLLDKMYIPSRYPDAFTEGAPWEHYTRVEALEAKRCAATVIEWVESCARAVKEAEGVGGGPRAAEEVGGEAPR